MSIRKLLDGTVEADTGEELALYELELGKTRAPVLKPIQSTNDYWVFVCRTHFIEEPEQKSIGLAGTRNCPVCGKILIQGPGTVVMRGVEASL